MRGFERRVFGCSGTSGRFLMNFLRELFDLNFLNDFFNCFDLIWVENLNFMTLLVGCRVVSRPNHFFIATYLKYFYLL